MRAVIAVPAPLRRLFTYSVPEALQPLCRPGMRVIAPFGRGRTAGLIVELQADATAPEPGFVLKPIERVLDESPLVNQQLLDLTAWAADYYGAGWSEMIRSALPGGGWLDLRRRPQPSDSGPRRHEWVLPAAAGAPASIDSGRAPGSRQSAVLRRLSEAGEEGLSAAALLRDASATHATLKALERRGRLRIVLRDAPRRRPLALRDPAPESEALRPTPEQATAIAAIDEMIAARRFGTCLLFGVTGSGKTEVYLRAVERTVAAGRQAIYLVPEIGLTPLLARRMQSRFGEALALLHSGLSDGERQDEWRRVRSGQVKVVLGARSAVFAPLADPGLLIVDEEHDGSYKQDEHPRYHGRDLAIVRGQKNDAAVILGSATPSMESYQHALAGKYRLLTLSGRAGGATLPIVHRVDMRQEFAEVGKDFVLSRRLVEGLRQRLLRREQSLVLLNRRGFSTFALCRACGESIECRHCSIAMTLHLRDRVLRCHYCNDSRPVPAACPACGKGALHFGGTGTERLETTLRSLLPGARIARMDRDTVRGRGAVEELLDRVESGAVDILLGTQMIAKGHDFPGVTLVGVVGADALLGLPDFRAGERTFQLLAQVAGRSGRRATEGEVIVQAYDADHHAVRAACEHDFEAFARAELQYRRALAYPPFSALAALVFRDRLFEKAAARAAAVVAAIRGGPTEEIQILGPAPAPLERLRGQFRVQVLLKARRRAALRAALRIVNEIVERDGRRAASLSIDVDPVSTL